MFTALYIIAAAVIVGATFCPFAAWIERENKKINEEYEGENENGNN